MKSIYVIDIKYITLVLKILETGILFRFVYSTNVNMLLHFYCMQLF